MPICTNCGTNINPNDRLCPSCGNTATGTGENVRPVGMIKDEPQLKISISSIELPELKSYDFRKKIPYVELPNFYEGSYGVYSCSSCNRLISKSTKECPHCHVRLVGIKCKNCKFVGDEKDFTNDRCPKCNSSSIASLGNLWNKKIGETETRLGPFVLKFLLIFVISIYLLLKILPDHLSNTIAGGLILAGVILVSLTISTLFTTGIYKDTIATIISPLKTTWGERIVAIVLSVLLLLFLINSFWPTPVNIEEPLRLKPELNFYYDWNSKVETELYTKYKNEGDIIFNSGNYYEAKLRYQLALSYKLGDQYIIKQIQKCDQKIAEINATDIEFEVFFHNEQRQPFLRIVIRGKDNFEYVLNKNTQELEILCEACNLTDTRKIKYSEWQKKYFSIDVKVEGNNTIFIISPNFQIQDVKGVYRDINKRKSWIDIFAKSY
jgi:RNA polymerase subunit RPABC4/transcription elongation factor Spt4